MTGCLRQAKMRLLLNSPQTALYHVRSPDRLIILTGTFINSTGGVLPSRARNDNAIMDDHRTAPLTAGAAWADITPEGSVFLHGYPHVRRMSAGVHDRLIASALHLSDGAASALVVANDVVCIGKTLVARVRSRIEKETGVPASNIYITATHTHSGPMTRTQDIYSFEEMPDVSRADPRFVALLENRIVEAGVRAVQNARPAEGGLGVADGSSVGTNRHDPQGATDPQVPVLAVRDRCNGDSLAVMLVGPTHPTVLHEDSTLVSGDFPAAARRYLRRRVFGHPCVVVYHTAPCGDQSPRHKIRANTFEEAARLGESLGQAVENIVSDIIYRSSVELDCLTTNVDLPRRAMLSEAEAQQGLRRARGRLETLCRDGAPRAEIRTAQCDLFGAENACVLARAKACGLLDGVWADALPAEIALLRIGPWRFIFWPGEIYVDFARQIKAQWPDCYLISLANGDLYGYLTTEEAKLQGHYEAASGLFVNPDAGDRLVRETLQLLAKASENGRKRGTRP